jgi:dTDP-4-amino-4,6-dideoxygalactose transaminase
MKGEILQKLDEVMSSSRFILGDNVKKLESDVAAYSMSNTMLG